MSTYTIITIAGDNGMTFAVGAFGTLAGAQKHADRLQECHNPDRDPEGMRYSGACIQTLAQWADQS